jgi:hypothetical protein
MKVRALVRISELKSTIDPLREHLSPRVKKDTMEELMKRCLTGKFYFLGAG